MFVHKIQAPEHIQNATTYTFTANAFVMDRDRVRTVPVHMGNRRMNANFYFSTLSLSLYPSFVALLTLFLFSFRSSSFWRAPFLPHFTSLSVSVCLSFFFSVSVFPSCANFLSIHRYFPMFLSVDFILFLSPISFTLGR